MFFRDIRYAARVLRRTPGSTAIAVLSLALGIGANSAMFSLADALLLRPLPVARPAEVVTIADTAPDHPIGSSISYPDYVDLRDQSKSFDSLLAMAYVPVGMAEQRDALPQLRLGVAVSGSFFQVMGVQPSLGRGFTLEEDRVPGRDAVTVLSHDAWEQFFAADPKVIGRRIRLNDVEFSIVGVAPKEFTGLDPLVRPHLYIPVMMLPRVSASADPKMLERRDNRMFTIKGRLKRGTSLAQATAEVGAIARHVAEAHPDTNRNRSFVVHTELQTRALQSPPNVAASAMLMGLAGLVLIIACANVANLLLSRARSRSREMAVRLAIGAGRGLLVRQLLTESLLMALAGGALGMVLASWTADYFSTLRFSNELPVFVSARLDMRVVVFSLAVAALSALIFGLAPAMRGAKTDLVPALKAGETNGWRRRTLGRDALVIAQVALSLMMLTAGTLFYRSLRAVLLGSPGFRTDHLLLMSFDPTLVRYTPDKTREFYRDLVERARQLPGVRSAALSQTVPFDGSAVASQRVAPEGFQFPQGKDSETVLCNTVGDRYFETFGTPIVAGRPLTATDIATSPRVAVINEEMAKHYWPGKNPVGQRFRMGDAKGPWVQVVGVAKTSVYLFIGENPTPFFYLPLAQDPQQRLSLFVETERDPAAFTDAVRGLVRSIDSHQPIYNVRTMSEYYRSVGVQGMRLIVQVIGVMGILGLAMALVGLYGLEAYSVSRRTREIGIRMAIGAGKSEILRMVLRHGFTLAFLGVGLGLAGSFGLIGIIRALFARMQAHGIFDPWTFVAVPLALCAVTMLASYLPARRAAAIDPNQALHYE